MIEPLSESSSTFTLVVMGVVDRTAVVKRKKEETRIGLLRCCKEEANPFPPLKALDIEPTKEKNGPAVVTECSTTRKPPLEMSYCDVDEVVIAT